MSFGNVSSRFLISSILCTGLLGSPWLNSTDGANRKGPEPQRFYVVVQRVSDAAPFWFDYILDVRLVGKDAIVRGIRIAPENSYCPGFVEVKAVEKRLPGISVRKVAGHIDLCSIQEEDVDHAIAGARLKTASSIFDTERFGVVAQCHDSERLFRLPYPETLDMAALKRNAPRAAALYGLEWEIYKHAFGKKDVFHDLTPAEDIELQRFGASLVSELRSGIYDLGFADEDQERLCRTHAPCNLGLTRGLLKGYEGPGHKPHGPTATLLERAKYHLVKYVAPRYPPLAMMAKIEGKVEVEISVDSASGAVKQVRATSGHPLLQKSAENAVKDWMFPSLSVPLARPVFAVLNYSLGCVDSPQE